MQQSLKELFRGALIVAASLLAALFIYFALQQYAIRVVGTKRLADSHVIWMIIWVSILFFVGPMLLRKWLQRAAEFVSAGLLAGVFIVFLLQIFSRYVLRDAFGWTVELCLILWLWIVFFGCAFIVRQRDHVTFDILYLAVPRPIRLVFALLACAAIVLAFTWAFVPTWDYIDWMGMRKTSTVRIPFEGSKIPLRTIFMVYGIFMIAVVIQFAVRLVNLILKREDPDEGEDYGADDGTDETLAEEPSS